MTGSGHEAILAIMNPHWPSWLRISGALASVVLTAALLFAFAAYAVRPFTAWFGEQTHAWPTWANLAFIAILIVTPTLLARHLIRRDQKADRANR